MKEIFQRSSVARWLKQMARSFQGPDLDPKMGASDSPSEVYPFILKQGSLKPSGDSRQFKTSLASSTSSRVPTTTSQNVPDPKMGNKKHLPSKRQTTNYQPYQTDASLERLLRVVTSDKFWHHPEEAVQCVPGRFESSEEYVRVFEPLLFEECRAQCTVPGRVSRKF
ncbi:putative ATP-dependent helicase-like [Iris pallida]|uniref:ATP-dependent helicase-like n=1 Tax=Iris pallida TaxID=29817 RepID=A0AAX6DPF3_IRIPA|nr:putative ATP-dependent helicase-like [Iris pallida]